MAAVISNRTAVFQGMRVIALLCIMLLHAGLPICDIGCPVSFFFVISGFLYKDKGECYKGYLWNKFKKIFPVFWITFAIDFFLNHRVLSWKMVPHLLLVQTYYPMPFESYDIDPYYYEYLGVSWFISCLFFCYLISPFIFKWIKQVSKEVLLLLILAAVSIMSIYLSFDIAEPYQKWCFYVSPFFRFGEYFLGMLLARMLVNTPPHAASLKSSVIGLILLIAYYIISVCPIMDYNLWAFPNLLVIGYLYMYDCPILKKTLGNKVMIRSAAYIMPIYLLHDSLMEFVRSHGGGWIWCIIWAIVVCVPYAVFDEFVTGKLQKKKA